jgi:hypothetical protein
MWLRSGGCIFVLGDAIFKEGLHNCSMVYIMGKIKEGKKISSLGRLVVTKRLKLVEGSGLD